MAAPKVLVAFHTSEGQTEKIAEHVGDILQLRGALVDVVPTDADPNPAPYDGVVVGDSIHMGRHSGSLVTWLRHHAAELTGLPTGLFQVSLVSATHDAEHTAQAAHLVEQLEERTGFSPDEVAMFAGALAYTRYGWFTRRVLRSIAAKEGGSTDMSSDHEYTDWADVERFANACFRRVADRPSPTEPSGAQS